MAKRRKLNKRVVVLLLVVGGTFVCGLGVWGGVKLYGYFFGERDPWVFARQAEQKQQESSDRPGQQPPGRNGDRPAGDRDFAAEHDLLSKAIGVASKTEHPDTYQFYYRRAGLLLDWIRSPEMTETERQDKWRRAIEDLRNAMRYNPKFVEAQRRLTSIYWDICMTMSAIGNPSRAPRWEQYIAEADKLAELAPTDFDVYAHRAYARARMAQNLKDKATIDLAVTDFRKAIELKKDDHNLWIQLSRFLHEMQQMDEVEKVFTDGMKANPNSAEIRAEYATFLQNQNRLDDARLKLREAIDLQPNSTVGNLALARLCMRERNWDGAQTALDAAKAINKTDVNVYLLMIDLLQYRRETDRTKIVAICREGLDALGKALAGAPNELTLDRLRLERAREEIHQRLANTLLDMAEGSKGEDRTRLADEARACLDKLPAPRGGETAIRLKIQGRLALLENKGPEALELLRKANEVFQNADPQTSGMVAALYLLQGFPGKALEVLDKCLEARGVRSAALWLMKARVILQYSRDYTEAARCVRRALDEEPGNIDAQRLQKALSSILARDEYIPSYVETTAEIIKIYLELADGFLNDSRGDKALRILRDLYRRVPDNSAVISRLYGLYFNAGQTDSAMALLKLVIAKNPDNKRLKNEMALLSETDPNRQFIKRMELLDADEEYTPFQKAMEKALWSLRAGRNADYVKYLKQAVEIDPKSSMAVERLFTMVLGLNDQPLAEYCCKVSADNDLDRLGGRMYAARLAFLRRQWPKVKALIDEILQLRPDSKQARTMLAEYYMNADKDVQDLGKAEDILKDLLSKDHAYIPAMILMAKIKEARGELREFREWILRLHDLAPNYSYVRDKYMEIVGDLGNPQDAIRRREAKYRQDPKDLQNCLHLIDLYYRTGNADEERLAKWIFETLSDKEFAAGVMADYHIRRGQVSEAQKVLGDMVQNSKNKFRAFLIYGDRAERFSPDLAEKAYLKAIELTPKNAQGNPSDDTGYRQLAELQAGQLRWTEAADNMAKALEIRPENMDVRRLTIQYRVNARQYIAAAAELERILSDNRDDAEALTLKAQMLLKQRSASRGQQDLSEPRELLDRAISLNPNIPGPYLLRAHVLLKAQDPVMAKKDLQAVRSKTSVPDVLMQVAAAYRGRWLKEYDQAEAIYLSIKAERKDYELAYIELIDLYLEQRKWDRLESLLAEGRQTFPKNAGMRVAEARMWLRRGDPAKRMAALEEAFRLAPRAPIVMETYMQALLDSEQYATVMKAAEPHLEYPILGPWVRASRAVAAVKLNDAAQAEELYKSAIRDIMRQQLEGVALRLEQGYGLDAAIAKVSQWCQDRPNDWRLTFTLGLLHRKAGEKNREASVKAIPILQKARDLTGDPKEKAQVSGIMGIVQYNLKNYDEARNAYLAVLAAEPTDYRTLNNLAYLLANDMNQPDQAMPYVKRALDLVGDEPDVLDTYGWTLAKSKDYKEAERVLVQAAQIREPSEVLRYHLGYVYEQAGNLMEADRYYRQGFELMKGKESDPLYAMLKEAVQRVQNSLRSGP